NKLLLVGGALAIVLLVGGLVLLNNKSTPQETTTAVQEELAPPISAEDIGLTLKQGKDSQRVIMEVTKTHDIESLDYELSYTAKGNIPRGAIGRVDVIAGKKVSQEMYLGTCSDVCHPDSDISNIKLIVKVTKTDGKVYQAEASL
ncbi:MAG: hypothetical protein AAB931_00330, partial [Patescibacteria group bacterium]